MSSSAPEDVVRPFRRYLSKTPEVTVFFWIVKVLASVAGGVIADLLTTTVGLGLGITTMLVATAVAAVMLVVFATARFVPRLYWLAVVLISVAGTLLVDNLTEILEVPLGAAVIALAVLLIGTFATWFATERTLSIHTIDTTRREAFHWLAVTLTFAVGTAVQRFAVAEFAAGYESIILTCAAVLMVAWLGRRLAGVGNLIAFWVSYTATQPLGIAVGGLLSDPRAAGGLGIGTAGTTAVVLPAIAAVAGYLSTTHRDDPSLDNATQHVRSRRDRDAHQPSVATRASRGRIARVTRNGRFGSR
jgi:uncharacterized membrane-anchored protein